jgi:hypothetical protein
MITNTYALCMVVDPDPGPYPKMDVNINKNLQKKGVISSF